MRIAKIMIRPWILYYHIWSVIRKANIDSLLCRKEQLFNECKLCGIHFKGSFFAINLNRHTYPINALFGKIRSHIMLLCFYTFGFQFCGVIAAIRLIGQ